MLNEHMGSSPISGTIISKTNRNKSCFLLLLSFLYSWQRSSLSEIKQTSLLKHNACIVGTMIAVGAARPIFTDCMTD